MTTEHKRWLIGLGVAFAVLVAWATDQDRESAVPAPVARPAPAAPQPPPLAVARVFDAATIVLTDGRTIRLGGITVRDPSTCGGALALAETQKQGPPGTPVKVVLTGGTDEHGNMWGHVTLMGGLAYQHVQDLGRHLAAGGLAEAYQRGADPAYVALVASEVANARRFHSGQYGPPCGPAWESDYTATDPATSGAGPDVDLGAGSGDDGESRFCRRRWWC